jgi:SapC
MMMYESAVPLSRTRHAAWHLQKRGFEFCREVSSAPIVTAEFAAAVLEYVVVFHETAQEMMPVAVLGIRPKQNLYLTEQGDWQARYIPAFVRRYPFVFASNDSNQTFTLCIDEMFDGFNQAGDGERLFDQSEPTPFVSNMLKFLQRYHSEFRRTQEFCKKLKDLNLMQPMQAQLSIESGEKMALAGFSVVDRARIKTLSKEALSRLMDSDELELIFAHLASLQNFGALRDRLGGANILNPRTV